MDKDSIIAAYSKDIDRYGEILDGEKQRELAKSIVRNKIIVDTYTRSLKDIKLTEETRDRLKSEYNEIESEIHSAREILTVTNLPFVIKKASKFARDGAELLDLIQEGSLKLYEKATEMYDPNHSSNSKFISYAGWWIDQSMSRTISNQSRHIRLPVHANELERKIRSFTDNFVNENSRNPSLEEISEGIEEKISKVKEMQINEESIKTLSLDYAIDEGDGTLMDTISYDVQKELEGPTNTNHLNIVEKLFDNARLTEKEKMVIGERFGLDSGDSKTLREVGKELKLTRERIRQIEIKSINKLKMAARKMKLNFEDLF